MDQPPIPQEIHVLAKVKPLPRWQFSDSPRKSCMPEAQTSPSKKRCQSYLFPKHVVVFDLIWLMPQNPIMGPWILRGETVSDLGAAGSALKGGPITLTAPRSPCILQMQVEKLGSPPWGNGWTGWRLSYEFLKSFLKPPVNWNQAKLRNHPRSCFFQIYKFWNHQPAKVQQTCWMPAELNKKTGPQTPTVPDFQAASSTRWSMWNLTTATSHWLGWRDSFTETRSFPNHQWYGFICVFPGYLSFNWQVGVFQVATGKHRFWVFKGWISAHICPINHLLISFHHLFTDHHRPSPRLPKSTPRPPALAWPVVQVGFS